MKIVVAPDSFKESLTASEAADAVEEGFRQVFPEAEIVKLPMSDGGEGLVHSLVSALDGEIVKKKVTGPLGGKVESFYGLIHEGKTAVIEMAAAAGLHLVPAEKRNPLKTTTYGVGELILAAIKKGAERIILGLGGSATNDGGAGLAQALGARLLDKDGNDIEFGGGGLSALSAIHTEGMHPRLSRVKIVAACDVTNPLLGAEGASAVFGPQKGATPEMIEILERNLAHFAKIIERDLGKRVHDIPGAGAAGGLGAGLLAFLPCSLRKGIEIVMEASGLEKEVRDADLLITGEGKIDSQTAFGKTPAGVAGAAKKYGVPVIAVAGSLGSGYERVYQHGIDAVFSIAPGICTLEEALRNGYTNLVHLSVNIAAVIKAFLRK